MLALLETPLGELLNAASTGTLDQVAPLAWRDGSAVTVVIAAENYPATPRTGDVITGADGDGVLHAGTKLVDDRSRGLRRRACAQCRRSRSGPRPARADAYSKISAIKLPGGHFRKDIGLAAVEGRIAIP